MNNENTPAPDIANLFNELSDPRQRYFFLKHLLKNKNKFVLKEFGPGNVTKECAVVLIEIFKSIVKFCSAQHDRISAVLTLLITTD